MRSIDKAKETYFLESTREEIWAYGKEIGVKFAPAVKTENARVALCKALGLPTELLSPGVEQIRARKPSVEIFPPYNLSPEGIWGGRRHRVKVGRPLDAHKDENHAEISWNGKEPFRFRFNEVCLMPEPIFNRIRDIQQKEIKQTKVRDHEGDVVEQRTEFVFHDKYPLSYLGLDEATADKCGSLLEWYQQKGPKWFKERNVRELRAIAERCDLGTHTRNELNKKIEPLSQDEMLAKLNTFFFGHPELEDDTEVAA